MYQLSIPSMLYMFGFRCFSQYDPRRSDMTILYAMWYDAMALAYKLFALSFSFLKSLFSFFGYGHNAKCTNQDSNCVYAGTILWHKGWYDDINMIWYVCNRGYRPWQWWEAVMLDVDPFLIIRNTLGNGKTANSKSPKEKCKMVLAKKRSWSFHP